MVDERRERQATLGCGTRILIALIVAIFSRPGLGDLEREVQGLREEVRSLKSAVEEQTKEIKALRGQAGKAGGRGQSAFAFGVACRLWDGLEIRPTRAATAISKVL